MIRIGAFFLSILFCHIGFTQKSDSTRYYLRFNSLGSLNRTDDGKAYLFNNALRFSITKKQLSVNASGNWIYGQQDQSLINNDFSNSIDFNIYSTAAKRFYYWGLGTYDKSYSLKVNNRFQAGLGVARNFALQKNITVNISDGLLYENSDLYLNDTLRDRYHTIRNSLRLTYKITVNNILTLDGQHFLQNSLSQKNDYIIKSSSSLSVKLNKWLSLTASLLYNKVNRTERENLLITYGLMIEKYF